MLFKTNKLFLGETTFMCDGILTKTKWLNPNFSFKKSFPIDSIVKSTPTKTKRVTNPKCTPVSDFWNKRKNEECWGVLSVSKEIDDDKKEMSRQIEPNGPATNKWLSFERNLTSDGTVILILKIFFIFIWCNKSQYHRYYVLSTFDLLKVLHLWK